MRKFSLILFLTLVVCLPSFCQHLAIPMSETQERGISRQHLDSVYKSAVFPSDTAKAVFKTEEEMEAMHSAYVSLIQDFGKFLSDHDFVWSQPRFCFNRIYFNANGTIDYFLYGFKGEDKIPEQKKEEFNQLLNLFIQDYKIQITSYRGFAQCGPVRYMPKQSGESKRE